MISAGTHAAIAGARTTFSAPSTCWAEPRPKRHFGGSACLPHHGSATLCRWASASRLLSVSFQPLTDLECGVHAELPVHALLPWPEVDGRLRHRDYLGPVDLVRVPTGHNGSRAFVEDVLEPIGAFPVREGDHEAVIMLDCDDRCLVRPARSPPDVADDRGVGSFLAG